MTPTRTPSQAAPTPPSGQLACWGFEEASGTLYDSVGGYNLTSTNNITYGSSGIIGNCIYLDASTDYAQGPNSGLELTTFSISVWIKTTDSTYTKYIYSKVSSNNRGVLLFVAPSGYVSMTINYNSVDCGGSIVSEGFPIYDKTVNDGSWHHVVYTYNGSTRGVVGYVDGSGYVTGNSSCVVGYDSGSTPLYIGNSRFGSEGFRGSIDELSLWDNVITAGNVVYLYNSGSGRSCPAVSPTPTITPSRTPSITPSISFSVTPSISFSVTPSISFSVTPSVSPAPATPKMYMYNTTSYSELCIENANVGSYDVINVSPSFPYCSYASGSADINRPAGTYTIGIYLTGSPSNQYMMTVIDSNNNSSCQNIDSAGTWYFYNQVVNGNQGVYVYLADGYC
jgi:hypothetical protein